MRSGSWRLACPTGAEHVKFEQLGGVLVAGLDGTSARSLHEVAGVDPDPQAADSTRGFEPKTSCGLLPESGAESIYVALGQPARGLAC